MRTQTAELVPTGGATRQCLTFDLNDDVFAVDIVHVTELLEHRELTTVPLMPGFLRGVLNLRGRVVPVVDLAERLGRGQTGIGRRTSIVIVRTDRGDGALPQDVGILVDTVNEVLPLRDEDVEAPPDFGAGFPAAYLRGMARHDGGFVLVLDIARVLDLREMGALARLLKAQRS